MDGVPLHGLKFAVPSVVLDKPAESGIATPSVCEKSVPRTEEGVEPEQNTPKSKLSPAIPESATSSASLALSALAKNAYQLPSEL